MSPKQLYAKALKLERQAHRMKVKAEKQAEREAFKAAGVKPKQVIRYNGYEWTVRYSTPWNSVKGKLELSRPSGGCAWGQSYDRDERKSCPYLKQYLAYESVSPFQMITPAQRRAENAAKRASITDRCVIKETAYRIERIESKLWDVVTGKAEHIARVRYDLQTKGRDGRFHAKSTHETLEHARAALVALRILV